MTLAANVVDPGSVSDQAGAARGAGSQRFDKEPIAIIGIGCRFPGGINDPETFWQFLKDGAEAIIEIPPDRIDVDTYYDPRPATPGKIMTRWGGFLDKIDQFDAAFFGIAPLEAERLDPQQRLLLEVAWEALEDAGQGSELLGSQTGVFIGQWLNDYEARLFEDPTATDFYMTTGSGRYAGPGRISYHFGFEGPSISIDSACSSSLVAVHLACQSLWHGECTLALAGGANVILQPHISIAYSQSQMMAPDGHCKFGDARADGYVRSEGAGIVVLKPLSQATRDGDPVYAVIRGSAVNNDGRSSGYLATPGRQGQEALLWRAYQDAGVAPHSVQYVEAHGTGTRAGDPVELQALGNVLGSGRPPGQPCAVGSVKSNLGHTEGAAGVAGLIKAALCLKQRAIPASLHVRELNPNIAWRKLGLTIPTELAPWPAYGEPAVAGVSAFGIVGTNAHVVLAEAPPPTLRHEQPAEPGRVQMLPLSAHTPEALKARARLFAEWLAAENTASIGDVCFTASCRRRHHEHRLALVERSRQELVKRLTAFLQGDTPASVATGWADPDQRPGLVFVCPGQGSQWMGMGRELLATETVFREAIERCEQAMQPFVDWSLVEQMCVDGSSSRLDEIGVIQPVLFALQVALSAWWGSRGLVPDAVIGHSMGEVAAAHIAGALSLQDAARIICLRSQLLQRISGQGVMAVVGLPLEQARETVTGFENRLSLAVSNSPRSTVLSGDPEAMEQVLDKLAADNVFGRLIKVDVASHSPQVDPLRADLLRLLEGLQPRAATIPIYSTVTGEICDGSDMDASYWVRNLRQPVLFSRMIQRLAADGRTVFVELSAHPILLSAIEENLHHLNKTGHVIPSLKREKPEQETMMGSLAALYTLGYPVAWRALYPAAGQVVRLPAYPWQRRRFWLDASPRGGDDRWRWMSRTSGDSREHPLLGHRLPALAHLPGCYAWQNRLDAGSRRYIQAHAIDNPVEAMVLTAATAVLGQKIHAVSELVINKPLLITETTAPTVQVVLSTQETGPVTCQVYSQADQEPDKWDLCASAQIEVGQVDTAWFYNLEWRLRPRKEQSAPSRPEEKGHWLLFSDQGEVGSILAARLEARGQAVSSVLAGDAYASTDQGYVVNPARAEDWERLLAAVLESDQAPVRGIVFLWGLDVPDTSALTVSALDEIPGRVAGGFIHLIQAVANLEGQRLGPLWLVTRGAQPAGMASTLSVAQAPLWGLGRVAALEHPDLWGGLVDLAGPGAAAGTLTDELDQLVTQLLQPDDETQMAFRGGQRYVARLVPDQALKPRSTPLVIRPEATYLITGGLGSLGLKAARWLVEQGATHLVLTSRDGLPERSQWTPGSPQAPAPESRMARRVAAVQELEALGATVKVARADVADWAQMSALWAELAREWPPVRGIIHTAGITAHSPLRAMQADALRSIFRAKVTGAWVLHQLTQTLESSPDLVMYSSGAALWGSYGLAHYAAANHFMDALAHLRVSQGLPALSVNWGWWAGEGITTGELAQQFAQVGLGVMPAEQALAALKYLLETGAVQRTVADIDWTKFVPIYEAKRKQPLLEEIKTEQQELPSAAAEAQGAQFLRELKETRPGDRWGLLLAHVREQAARVLGFASPDLLDLRQGFFKMGMDSIMTVRLRNRLEASLDCSLPPTTAFEYPNVEALTRHLITNVLALDTVDAASQDTAASVEAPTAAAEDKEMARLDGLSEDELLHLLDAELSAIDELTERA